VIAGVSSARESFWTVGYTGRRRETVSLSVVACVTPTDDGLRGKRVGRRRAGSSGTGKRTRKRLRKENGEEKTGPENNNIQRFGGIT